MKALEALTTRRSVRRWARRPVPREVLVQAVTAARLAPTARNLQPWEFVVVTEPATLRELAAATDHGRFASEAAACVAVLCRETKYYLEDGCAAVVCLLTALHALGLGACWVAGDKKPYAPVLAARLGAPAEFKLVALVPCGYADGPPPGPPKRGVGEVLHWERFGER